MDELREALAFDRALRLRAATRTIPLPEGVVVLREDLRSLHHLNAVMLDAPLAPRVDAEALAQLAERHLGHLGHRLVVLDDADAAERLAPELLAAGWTRQRTVYMAWRREPDRALTAGLVREISDQEMRALQHALYAEEAPSNGAVERSLAELLVNGQEVLRAATPARCYGARSGGKLACSGTLFLDRPGGIAMIEEVATLRPFRERGLARAVVSQALAVARELGRSPIVIPADVDDWPQLLYLKLGFEPLGRQVSFALRSAGGPSPLSP